MFRLYVEKRHPKFVEKRREAARKRWESIFEEVRLHKEGKIVLRNAREAMLELAREDKLSEMRIKKRSKRRLKNNRFVRK